MYFTYDNPDMQLVSKSDSSITIKMMRSGKINLHAKIFTGCLWIEDSISFNASIATINFNLGKDTGICAGNTLQLHAGKGFVEYLWNDGSTDSVLNVTQPGKYYVQVKDGCAKTLSDSIIVTTAPKPVLDLGPDQLICENEKVTLMAPSGFINYAWGPDYRISQLSGKDVIVNPSKETTYYVKAEKSPGCFAYDTVMFTVKYAPQINLGADRNFCAGDSAVVIADAGFQNYKWSNRMSTANAVLKQKGIYSVIHTTSDGCPSYDTIAVTDVWPLPDIDLGDNILCTGAQRTLDAGNGYTSYLWQDGSTGSTFTVSGTGTYSVTVTDMHQCKAKEILSINTLAPLPAAFLPGDTIICIGAELQIKPLDNYNKYLWSTGQNNSSIVTRQGGYMAASYRCQ